MESSRSERRENGRSGECAAQRIRGVAGAWGQGEPVVPSNTMETFGKKNLLRPQRLMDGGSTIKLHIPNVITAGSILNWQ